MELHRVHPGEWLIAACGGALVIGLMLDFSDGESALHSVNLLDLLLVAAAAGGLILPVIVARSSRTDVPITFETFLSTLVSLVAVILLFEVIWQPDGGLQAGFFLSLAACLVMTAAGWRSVAREN
ncbi:MAG: hypothetical protein ACERKT_00335 [Acidobacteriota bacterium]